MVLLEPIPNSHLALLIALVLTSHRRLLPLLTKGALFAGILTVLGHVACGLTHSGHSHNTQSPQPARPSSQ